MATFAGLVAGDGEESLVLSRHIFRAWGSMEEIVEDLIQVITEDWAFRGHVEQSTFELCNRPDDDYSDFQNSVSVLPVL